MLHFRHIRQNCFEIHVAPQYEQIKCASAAVDRARINTDSPTPVILSCKVFAELGVACDALFRIKKRIPIPIKKRSKYFAELLEVKICNVSNQAVSGQDGQPSRVRVYECHHGNLVSR